MRTIAAALVAALLCPPVHAEQPSQWRKLQWYGSTKPASSDGAIFWTTLCSAGWPCPFPTAPAGLVRNEWNVVSVTDLGVPAHAAQIRVVGSLIITHANNGVLYYGGGNIWRPIWEIANLKVGFRAFGDTTPIENNNTDCVRCQWYIGHTIETDTGQRTPFSTDVPVKDGKIEVRFECTKGHDNTDAVSACGINLSVREWAEEIP